MLLLAEQCLSSSGGKDAVRDVRALPWAFTTGHADAPAAGVAVGTGKQRRVEARDLAFDLLRVRRIMYTANAK